MTIGNGEWKLWREGEPLSQRFGATFSDDGNTITGGRVRTAQRVLPAAPGRGDLRGL